MEVIINKNPITIPHGLNIIALLDYIQSPRYVAVFINGQQLLFSQYDEYILEENDDVKIMRALGGG